jgi:aspartyl-tRNA(Asn)/glutamyl-tRNA(Gln) amidotransferase subunit C
MTLSFEEVEHIANLARLELTDAEKELFCRQLSDILEFAARLSQVKTEDILPTSSVLPPRGALRPDQPAEGLDRQDVLDNAPQVQDDQFLVPPVLE